MHTTSNAACRHSAHFYLGGYPAERVGDFIAAGLHAGEACVLLLTELHRRAVEKRLRALGLPADARRAQGGSYRTIDTHEALGQVFTEGRLDLPLAKALLTDVLRPPASTRTPRTCAVGDLAPTLLANGHAGAALAFESAVDRLAVVHGAKVFCAYPLAHFWREGRPRSLIGVCAEHAALEFPDRPWAHGFLPPADAARAMLSVWAATAGRTRP